MTTVSRIANIFSRIVLLSSLFLQTNLLPARAATGRNLLEAMAWWAETNYCWSDHLCQDLEQDYYNGFKHLGYVSAEATAVLVSGEATVYFDLDDYMGITPEGKNGWVTVWADLSGKVGIDMPSVPLGTGIARIPREPGIDDPQRSFKIEVLGASSALWEFTLLAANSDGTVQPEASHGENINSPVITLLGINVNIYRTEYQKSYIDRLAIQAIKNALLLGPVSGLNVGLELYNQFFEISNTGLLGVNILPDPGEQRTFTSLDNGQEYSLAGMIESARGGIDINGDKIPDNAFPTSYYWGHLSVNFYALSTNQENYYVKVVSKPDGWHVWADDNDGPVITGYYNDDRYDVANLPNDAYAKTQWLVQRNSGVDSGTIVFELWVSYWENFLPKNKRLDTFNVPVTRLATTNPDDAPRISPVAVPSSTAGLPVTVSSAITDSDGIKGAWLYYLHVPGSWVKLDMQHISGDQYQATIPGSAVAEPEIIYYISAFDGAAISYTQNMAFNVTAPLSIKTVTVLPDKTQYRPGELVTLNVSLRDGNNSPLTGASLSYVVDNRNPSSAFTEIGSGNYRIQFTTPSAARDYPVTVTASKSGYLTGQGGATITVYQAADPGHNVKANYISVDAGTHLPNQSIRIVGNLVNLGTYTEQARLVFRLKDPNGVVIGTSNGPTFSIQAGYQSQNYAADLVIGSSTGEYQAEVTAEIVGYSDFDPTDNKLKAPVYVGTTPTFNEFGLVQVAVVEGQTSGVVQNHKIKVLSASGSSASIDVLRSDNSTVTDCYHKTVNADVIVLCDSDRFAVILDAVASSVPREAWFYVGQGGNIDNTDITFSPENAVTPAGTTATYHVTANSTRRLVNFDITIRGSGDDFNTISTWDFSSHRHGNYYDWDLELDVPGDATVKKYMYWVRFDDSYETTYDRFIRRLWVDVKPPHNIQVNSVTPASSSITEGSTVQIQSNISNLSTYTEYNLEATCKISGPNGYSQVLTQTLPSLGSNASQTLSWNWATAGLAAGTYTLQVTVPLSIDATPANNMLSVTNTLVIPPQLTVAPATDKTSYFQAEAIRVSASVMSAGNPVTDASVLYFLKNTSNNTVLSGNLTHTSGGSYQASVAAPLQTGTYQFTVSASKSGTVGASANTANITINMAPPIVQILSATPLDGQLINYKDLTFHWAGSAIGVSSDQLQYSYRLDSQAWSPYSSQTSLNLVDLSEGAHTFQVKVRLSGGMENPTPASRAFSVDTQPPVFQATPTANAASYTDGATVTLQVDLDTAANVTASFSNLDSEYAPSQVTVTESNPASHIYTIMYTIHANNTYPDNSYPVTIYAIDNAGNTTVNSALPIRLDNANPTVTQTDPTPNAVDVDLGSPIIVYFSEPMNKASVQSAFSISPPISGTMTWIGNSLMFTPGVNLTCATSYTVQVGSSATDLPGKPLPFTSWSFATRGCSFSEIDIKGNGLSIQDGDSTPSLDDHTNFGSVDVANGTLTRTFTIHNTGTANLILTGSPRVSITGANAADFVVSAQPSSPITGPSGSAVFTVTFNPNGSGLRTATLSIASNDMDENPYTFAVQGTGVSTSSCGSLLFADDFSTSKAWVDQSNGYIVRDMVNQQLNWTSARSHPMRYYIPISAASNCIQLKFRFNVKSASGNGGVYFGLAENLDAPANIWGIDATGIFAGLDRDTAYGHKVALASLYSNGGFDGVDNEASTINYGGYNLWRKATLTVDHGSWSIVVTTDNGSPVGQMSGTLTGQHTAYNYVMMVFEVPSGWETETGSLDDVQVYGTSLTPVTQTFSDVPIQYWAWSFIERLYAAGITGGCVLNPPQYCPENTVTRAQMAVFLERGIHGSSYNPPAVGSSTGFGDVPTTYWSAAWVKQLAADGITGGCGPSTYCPEAPVTRAQMAVFLLRSKYGSSYSPPSVGSSTGFTDVPSTYWAAAWIKQLVAEGITSGCGASTYCPEAPVTRAQMAVFLVRTFSLP